jgi:hypothetical protein
MTAAIVHAVVQAAAHISAIIAMIPGDTFPPPIG